MEQNQGNEVMEQNQGNEVMEQNPGGGEGLAIASMVLGIVALVVSCCFYYISIPCAILGVILAAASLGTKRPGRGMAIAGLVCSIVSLVPAIIVMSTGSAIISLFN